jgi:hypothetical protein
MRVDRGLNVVILICVGRLRRPTAVALPPSRHHVDTRSKDKQTTYVRHIPAGADEHQLPEAGVAYERRQRMSEVRRTCDGRSSRQRVPAERLHLHQDCCRHERFRRTVTDLI